MKKATRKKIRIALWCLVALAALVALILWVIDLTKVAATPTFEQAEELLYEKASSLAGTGVGEVNKMVSGDLEIKVSSLEQNGGECKVKVSVTVHGIAAVIEDRMSEIHALAEPDENGEMLKSDEQKAKIAELIAQWYTEADPQTTELEVLLADSNGYWEVYGDQAFSDAVSGGLCSLSLSLDDSENKAEKRLFTCIEYKCETEYPDTRNGLQVMLDDLVDDFKLNFIESSRWKMIVRGLGTTLQVTFFSAIFGIILGFIVAIIRVTHDKTGSLGFLNAICKVYLTVIRGTPAVIQLMIIYFVILAPIKAPKLIAAIIGFSINSGAYVAEIVRGGIMSIDQGQTEAGRSLGLSYTQTMVQIIMPQALKNVLPSLANEFIVLLKETSVSAFIALEDLTRAGDKIRGATYSAFMPLIAVALIYLVMVMILSYLVGRLERRLGKSDRR